MKRFLGPALLACLLVNVLNVSSVYGGAKTKLTLTLSLDKDTYQSSDSIFLKATLTNRGKKPVWVNSRFAIGSKSMPKEHRDMFLELTAPEGNALTSKYSHRVGFPKTDYFMLLHPGEEVSREHEANLQAYFDLKGPGTYRVVGAYENVYGEELGLDTFKDKLISKAVSFRIKE